MGRAYEMYEEEEYETDEATRFAQSSSRPSYDDEFGQDRTRSARQSYVEHEQLPRSNVRASRVAGGEIARASFVAPAELEGARSPAMRARRASMVASSEREDFASSADVEEVTSYRVPPTPVAEPLYSSDVEEAHSIERSRPIDYEALKSYLFSDVAPDSPHARAMSSEDHSVSMETPVAPMRPPQPQRTTHNAFRPQMHTMRPESVAPAARISHNAFRPQSVPPAARSSHVAFRPQMRSVAPPSVIPPSMRLPMASIHPAYGAMAMPAPQDSYVDSSWIVPTPLYPAPSLPSAGAAGFKLTLSFVAAAITAVVALAVMVGAILFIRSDDRSVPAATNTLALAAPPVLDAPMVPAIELKPALVVAPKPVAVAPAAPVAHAAPITPVAKEKATKKTAAAKPEKAAEKSSDKDVEAMLAALGEEQLRR